jgi:hypothetical protein
VANASGFFFNNVQVTGGGGGGTPGGANATIQYSNNAAFAGSSNLTYNWTTTVLAIGAGTGVTINSSAFSGTANNALNLGGTVASGYQTAAGLSANVILLTANNANFLGGVAAAGYQTGAGLAANVLTLTANNATNFGGLPPSSYLSTAGLAANVLTMTSNNTLFHVSGQTNINSTSWGIGNTIANTTVNSTIIAVSSPGVNTQVNTTAMSFGISAISPVTISSTGAVPQVIDAFPLATYRAAEYLISIKDNNANNYQLSKILLLHTGGDAILTSYGTLISNTDLGGFTASANATAAALTFNPTSASTVLKINRILLAV